MAKKTKAEVSSTGNGGKPKAPRIGTEERDKGFLGKPGVMIVVVLLSILASVAKLYSTAGPKGLMHSFKVLMSTITAGPQDNVVLPDLVTPETHDDGSAIIPKNANPEGKPREALKECVDRHEECKQFFKQGECLKNPGWMIINCPQSCDKQVNACALRDPKLRCDRKKLGISTQPIYQSGRHVQEAVQTPDRDQEDSDNNGGNVVHSRYVPGDMQHMFEQIVDRFSHKYPVTVLSTSPYLVIFDNFTTPAEGDALVALPPRWERSTDTGTMNEYGESGRVLSQGRTSSNAWCTGPCETSPIVQGVFRKIEEVTGVPRSHYESFQVLRYEANQHYTVHHDYGVEDIHLACGPRILTFFLYLSDVEEGGETFFPQINGGVKVTPKRGRAVLWPSVLDEDVLMQDTRTTHAALPVKRGLKLAANAWLHLYDYSKPNLWGCTGSFDELG